MTAIPLLDLLARGGEERPSPASLAPLAQFSKGLLESALESALADLQRLREYEQQCGVSESADDDIALAQARSIWRLYERWALEVGQLQARIGELGSDGGSVSGADKLRDAYNSVRARLGITPDKLVRAARQVRAGNVIPLEDLRHELQSRLRG